jgi:RNA polymerase-binding transcription factor
MASPRKAAPKKAATKAADTKAKSTGKAAVAKPRPPVKSEPKPKVRPRTHVPVGGGAPGGSRFAERIEPPEEMPIPGKPMKPVVDAEWQSAIRDALARQRQQLLSVVQSTQAQMAEKSGDLPDVSDRASEGFEDELSVGLIAIEAAQLDDIEAAIARIDDGSYGLCQDCRRPIPRKRLEVLPFARRCLNCEGANERRVRNIEPEEDEEEAD